MSRTLILLGWVALASGCARHDEARTAEVHGPDGGRFYATVYHFLTAADEYDRASYVHGGESYREEMGRHFAGRPPGQFLRLFRLGFPSGQAFRLRSRSTRRCRRSCGKGCRTRPG